MLLLNITKIREWDWDMIFSFASKNAYQKQNETLNIIKLSTKNLGVLLFGGFHIVFCI